MLGNHGLIAILPGKPPAPLDKGGKQVAFAVRIVVLDILVQGGVSVAYRHIRRIGNHHIILPCQQRAEIPGV